MRASEEIARLRLAGFAAGAIAISLAAVAPLLWLLGSLDEVEWHGDFITGVTMSVLIFTTAAVGFVSARWTSLLLIWAIAAAWVVVEQLRWDDDPTLSGIDDLSPLFLLARVIARSRFS